MKNIITSACLMFVSMTAVGGMIINSDGSSSIISGNIIINADGTPSIIIGD